MAEEKEEMMYQIFLKEIDGKTRTLNFRSPTIPIDAIKSRIENLTKIPIPHQLLLSNNRLLQPNDAPLCLTKFPTAVHLLLRLRGGKGGFGSLLRGAATKAGQKKTNNFDACRDMSGRRLRHVNAEKKMEEWKAEEEERKLEKLGEEFCKKRVKEAKKLRKGGDNEAQKYVDKYRKDSARCMEEVDKTVRQALGPGFFKNNSKGHIKRKALQEASGGSDDKKLKIWKGKGVLEECDSDDSDEDDSDCEMEERDEKSDVTDIAKKSDLRKEEGDATSESVTGGNGQGESSVGCSSGSCSVEEKDTVENGKLQLSEEFLEGGALNQGNGQKEPTSEIHEESEVQCKNDSCLEEAAASESEATLAELKELIKPECGNAEEIIVSQLPSRSTMGESGSRDEEASVNRFVEPINLEEKVVDINNDVNLDKPLDFNEYASAVDMQVLGMERLKSELQERGLKCGGTLQERAARLFLLKTMPLDKLPKKLLAKK